MKRWIWLLVPLWLAGADRAGPYLGAGMGASTYDDDGRLAEIETTDAVYFRLSAGAFINEYFSVEFGLAHFNDFDGYAQDGTKATDRFHTFTANALGHYPVMDGRFDFFAKFGAGQVFWSESGKPNRESSAAVLVFGAGVGVRATSWLTFNLGFDYHSFGMDVNTTRYEMGLSAAYLEMQVQF
jgi:hypothetical protein